MSHFSVLAIQKHGRGDIDDMMAPYDENLEAEPRIDKTRQELIDEEKNRLAHILDGDLVKEYLKDAEAFKAKYSGVGDKYKIEYAERQLADYYKYAAGSYTEEDYYQSAIEGEDPDRFDEDGNLMTTYNENSKYDYYGEGGRWNGMIILKNGSRVDSAEFKDIDWKAMNTLDPTEEKRIRELWRLYINKGGTKQEQEKFQKDNFIFYKESYYIERYGTMEEHLRQAGMWSTFAVVDEDGWHEQGEMGWFGMSSDTPEEAGDWTKKFEERFIKNCNPDDVLTVLDCHI